MRSSLVAHKQHKAKVEMAWESRFFLLGRLIAFIFVYCVAGEDEAGFPPVFIEKPQNTSVRMYHRVALKCRVKSDPAATITWLKNGKPIYNNRYFYPYKRAMLVISMAHHTDAGKFTCIARNTHGSVSADAYLIVITQSAPVFTKKPKNVTLFTGEVYMMSCEAVGLPAPTYTWYYNGDNLQDSAVILQLEGALFFADVRLADSGHYACLAHNAHGFDTAGAYLNVVKEPTVVKGPEDLVGASGTTAIFTCSVAASQMYLRVVWRKDGHELRSNSKYEMTGPVQDDILLKFSLKIKNIQPSDDDSQYQCKAIKNINSSISRAALLTVINPERPQVAVFQKSVSALHDSDVTTECAASGYPLPEVRWYRNNKQLQSGPDINITTVISTSIKTVKSFIRISDVWYKDEGTYICLANNTAGRDEESVTLFVYGKPRRPTDVKVNQTSKNKILVSWIPGHDGGDMAKFLVSYRLNGSSTWTLVSVAENQTSVSIEILIGEKLFFFQVKAKNKYGMSLPSAEMSFTGRLLNPRNGERKPEQRDESASVGAGTVVGGVLGGGAIVFLVTAIIIVIRMRQRKPNGERFLPPVLYTSETTELSTDDEDERRRMNTYAYVQVLKKGDYATPNVRTESGASANEELENEYDNICRPVQYEVPKRNVSLGSEIGSGHFGRVVKGYLKVKEGKKVVAVKMLKACADEKEKKSFMAELDFMKSLAPHPNIVGLVGCCTKSDNPYILVEYCSMGNLQTFLRSSRAKEGIVYSNLAGGSFTLRSKDLLSFAWQIARGMAYLASVRCVHRDLAARNILVAEGNTCKIADFGLARDIYNDNHYIKTTDGELPLRWMAYESIFRGVTTTESDVWSFGVLLWEIITLGANPYPAMKKEQIITNLHLGKRMPKPPYCSDELYAVMWECWQQDPAHRPSFSELCKTLERLMTAEKISIDLANFDPLYGNSSEE